MQIMPGLDGRDDERKDERRALERKRQRQRKRRLRRLRARIVRAVTVISAVLLVFIIFLAGRFLMKKFGSEEEKEAGIFLSELFSEKGNLVVLDAGHGGNDQGTSSGKILEKDINLQVVKLLEKELKKQNVHVLLTRDKDVRVELSERTELANEKEAVLFVSIHCNFCEDSKKVEGTEIYYLEGSESGRALAEALSGKFDGEPKIVNRGTRTDNFKVLRETQMPAVLIELGYLSNPEEKKKLNEKDYQKLLVKYIAEMILESGAAEL